MTKRQSKAKKAEGRQVPMVWDFPDHLVSGYATNMLVQAGEHEMYVSFFEAPPPVILAPEDVEGLDYVRAECFARIIISPDRLALFIEVLQKQLGVYRTKKEAEAISNGEK